MHQAANAVCEIAALRLPERGRLARAKGKLLVVRFNV